LALAYDPKQQATAQFKKPRRADDASKAKAEYENKANAVRVQMAKLRELRLARDAAAATTAAPKKVGSATTKKGTKKSKLATATLSSWLESRDDRGHKN